MKATSEKKGLLTVKQAAEAVPCSESTIKRRIRSGELPAKTFGKSGRAYRIDPDDLDRLMVASSYSKGEPSEEERLAAIAAEVAAQAPALTPERKARLRELLS